jgi:hypothetical protein
MARNAGTGISRHSMDNQQKKEHLMKIGIYSASYNLGGKAQRHRGSNANQ